MINILNNAKDALKDNAGGIPENIIEKIFDPYFTTKEATGGIGLGLYITHTIVTKNLKGSVIAENEIFEYDGI